MGVGQWIGISPQAGHETQHGPVERPVDLNQWQLTGVIDVHHRYVTKESWKIMKPYETSSK